MADRGGGRRPGVCPTRTSEQQEGQQSSHQDSSSEAARTAEQQQLSRTEHSHQGHKQCPPSAFEILEGRVAIRSVLQCQIPALVIQVECRHNHHRIGHLHLFTCRIVQQNLVLGGVVGVAVTVHSGKACGRQQDIGGQFLTRIHHHERCGDVQPADLSGGRSRQGWAAGGRPKGIPNAKPPSEALLRFGRREDATLRD